LGTGGIFARFSFLFGDFCLLDDYTTGGFSGFSCFGFIYSGSMIFFLLVICMYSTLFPARE